MPKDPSLVGISHKINRADKHLQEALSITASYAEGECVILPEKDLDQQITVLRINITPKVSPELSAIAGDFLFNVRSALDHLVWQLAIANKCEPGSSNQFPIAITDDGFKDALRRGRLNGIHEKAATLIEWLQPYEGRDNPLRLLNALHNVDKHRELNVVTVVADSAGLLGSYGDHHIIRMMLGDCELRDGAIFGNIGIPFDLPQEFSILNKRISEVKMQGKCSLFVAFHDPACEDLEEFRVDRTLKEIFYFIRDEVIPAFDPFLDAKADEV